MPTEHKIMSYKFEELDDNAKEKAREWWRSASADDNYWSEYVIDDAHAIAAMLGIELKLHNKKPCIWWRGFWSQGDGASFEGWIRLRDVDAAKLKSHAPLDEELHSIADNLERLKADDKFGTSAMITQNDRYTHEYTMSFEFFTDRDLIDEDVNEDDWFPSTETQDAIVEACRDFARWIYRCLEQEYEHQNSDEVVDENIKINEYDFYVDGRRF